ncbi:MAG: hypothetical protein WA981_07300 [Glaciecola sp.]
MTLYDNILLEIESGALVEPFSTNDLKNNPISNQYGRFKVCQNDFSAATIATFPANNSVSVDGKKMGRHVKMVHILFFTEK